MGHLPGYAYDFEIRSLPKFLRKKKTFKAKLKITFFFRKRGGLKSSRLTVL